MKNTWKIPGVLFLLMALVEITAVTFGYEKIHFYLKPYLVPVLAVTAGTFLYSRKAPATFIWLLMLSLCFHTLGDIFLLSDKFSFFIWGIAAFLAGHLFTLAILLLVLKPLKYQPLPSGRMVADHTVALLVPVLLALLVPRASVWMRLLVAVYSYVLLAVAGASGRCVTYKICGGKALLAGITLFIVSDGTIAAHTFLGLDFPLRHAFVMGTYLIAQGLIVSGLCRAVISGAGTVRK